MRVSFTVNPNKANNMHDGVPELGIKPSKRDQAGNVMAGATTSRPLEVEYDLGDKIYFAFENDQSALDAINHVVQLYGAKAVYAHFVKGAKLPIQQKGRLEADIQTAEDGSTYWKTDEEVAASFNGWKLPDDVPNPEAAAQKSSEAWERLTPEKKNEALRKALEGKGIPEAKLRELGLL